MRATCVFRCSSERSVAIPASVARTASTKMQRQYCSSTRRSASSSPPTLASTRSSSTLASVFLLRAALTTTLGCAAAVCFNGKTMSLLCPNCSEPTEMDLKSPLSSTFQPPHGSPTSQFSTSSLMMTSSAIVASSWLIMLTKAVPTKPASGMKTYMPSPSLARSSSNFESRSFPKPNVCSVPGSLPPCPLLYARSASMWPPSGTLFGTPSVSSSIAAEAPGRAAASRRSMPVFNPSQRLVWPSATRDCRACSAKPFPSAVMELRLSTVEAWLE
mmetsp:Transcript_53666/g.143818  ORF Transcript_53666/g.143818 Transcript_53666/m.143818 type:complete len:273 (+) Transcript_53666:391-1209(+)